MRLLLDANVSPKLLRLLPERHAGSVYVEDLGLGDASDHAIWDYAANEALTILTQDSDFRDIQLVRGSPPKVIWLRIGNPPNRRLIAALRAYDDALAAFLADPGAGCLEIREPRPRVV